MLLKEYNKGDIVFREGDRDYCMYRIIEGAVDVFTEVFLFLREDFFFKKSRIHENIERINHS